MSMFYGFTAQKPSRTWTPGKVQLANDSLPLDRIGVKVVTDLPYVPSMSTASFFGLGQGTFRIPASQRYL
jgi:hypothetical protein